jgi:PAS domain-containing protein
MIIRYDIAANAFAEQDLTHIGITDSDIAEMACAFRRIGFWRTDVTSGLFYWSEGLFRIFGMEFTTGPISISEANALIHPDDVTPIYELLDQALAEKTAFHYILRIRARDDEYRYVRCIGKYRTGPTGGGEMIGMLYEFFEPIRTVALAAAPGR